MRKDIVPAIILISCFITGIIFSISLFLFNITENINRDAYGSLLTTNATIIATIVTVSFAFSIFTIPHASENYTLNMLTDYLKDKSTWISFSLLSISVIANIIGIIISIFHTLIINITIFLTAYSFVLLAYNFYSISKMVNPKLVIERMEKDIFQSIIKKSKDIQKKTSDTVDSKESPIYD
jgi:hypothetical protein